MITKDRRFPRFAFTLALFLSVLYAAPASTASLERFDRDPSHAAFDYTFEGTFEVDINSTMRPLRGMQIRMVRRKGGVVEDGS